MSYDEQLTTAEVDAASRQWAAIQQLSADELAALIEAQEQECAP